MHRRPAGRGRALGAGALKGSVLRRSPRVTADGSEREAGRGEGGRSALTRARREPDTTGYARRPTPDARRPTPDARAAAGNGWVGRDDRRGKTVEVARAARRRTHRARPAARVAQISSPSSNSLCRIA
ncbi:hypothetical protein DIJ63_12960 [Burkholderia pseudomallei]|nr:hypothetical protein DIJ63_12960 [Burkholderia pseudomallei]